MSGTGVNFSFIHNHCRILTAFKRKSITHSQQSRFAGTQEIERSTNSFLSFKKRFTFWDKVLCVLIWPWLLLAAGHALELLILFSAPERYVIGVCHCLVDLFSFKEQDGYVTLAWPPGVPFIEWSCHVFVECWAGSVFRPSWQDGWAKRVNIDLLWIW